MNKADGKKVKLFNKNFFIIALANLGVSTMMQMFNSTIALHLDRQAYPASIAGTMISIGAVSATIYRFFGGKLCEHQGRKHLIVAGLGCFAVMSFLMGNTSSLLLLYILRVMQMLGYSMASTAVSVAVIDVIPRQRVGEGIGYFSLASSISQAFGPSLALALFHMNGGFFTVMTGTALMGMAAMGITAVFLNYERPGYKRAVTDRGTADDKKAVTGSRAADNKKAVTGSGAADDKKALCGNAAGVNCCGKTAQAYSREHVGVNFEEPTKSDNAAFGRQPAEAGLWKFIEKKALPAAIINFFITFSGCLITMYLTLYASKAGIANAGLFFSISVVFMVAARIVSGRLSDRYGAMRAVIPGVTILIAAYLLLILAGRQHYLYYIAGAFYGFGSGMASPALNAEAVRGVPAHRVSIASSTFFLPLDIAFVAGSVIWGILIDRLEFSAVFLTAALVAAGAIVLTIILLGRVNKTVTVQTG